METFHSNLHLNKKCNINDSKNTQCWLYLTLLIIQMNTFILQRCIKLVKSDSKSIKGCYKKI